MSLRQLLITSQWITIWILLQGTIVSMQDGDTSDVREYCQTENFQAECPPNYVIVVSAAKFGRMAAGRCIGEDLGHLGCWSDAMAVLDRLCSGRRSCQFDVRQLIDSVPSVCHRELVRYLEASYLCIPVTTSIDTDCDASSKDRTSPLQGYISNAITMETDRGSRHCPWILRAHPGQRINITLINFARAPLLEEGAEGGGPGKFEPTVCYHLATIRDEGYSKAVTGCEGEERSKVVHVTTSSVVTISVETDPTSQTYFLLHYTVSGCPTLSAPRGGWVRQEGGTATLGCSKDAEQDSTWHVTCDGTRWMGAGGDKNCTVSKGILLVVAIGVALGVFLGGLLLTCVHHRIKRKHTKNEALASTGSGMYVSQATNKLPKEDFRMSCPYVTDGAHMPAGCDTLGPGAGDVKYFEGEFNDYCKNMRPVFLPSKCSAHLYESPQFDRKGSGSD